MILNSTNTCEFNLTPIELYSIKKIPVYVKREDLCAPDGAPPFSKVRGLVEHLKTLKKAGFTTIGYTETSISMAGWGVSWACNILGMNSVIFDPIYKNIPPEHKVLDYHREQWKKYNATIIPIKAGMAKVNFNMSKKIMAFEYNSSAMLPLGLPLVETIIATKNEIMLSNTYPKSVVVNIGSGTICSGLIAWLYDKNVKVYGIMGRTGDIQKKKMKILSLSAYGCFAPYLNFFSVITNNLTLIDPGYNYTDEVKIDVPFPCNKYYDAKAWKWLTENIHKLEQPILFWNIGNNTPVGE